MAAFALLFGATSCSDVLDTTSSSQLEAPEIFNDPATAEGAIIGVYHSMFENRAYRNTLVGIMFTNTDAEINRSTKADATSTMALVAMYKFTPGLKDNGFNDSNAGDPWSRIYKCIELCNQSIVGLRQYGDQNNSLSNYLLGEALTLRAFFYNDLTRIWGDVPARFAPVDNNTLFMGKTYRGDIYEQILADLEEAETLVPWAGEISQTNSVERVNKEFVLGLKARIALMAAGKSLIADNGAGKIDYVFEDEAKRDALYKIALDATEEIISNTKMQISSSYQSIFKDQVTGITTVGRESIFELPASSSRGEFLAYVGHRRDVSSTTADPYTYVNVNGRLYMNPVLFYDYESGDNRRDFSALPYYYKDNTPTIASNASTLYLAKWRAEWLQSPMLSTDDGINYMVMRLADVYLMNAEANNYFGNISAAKNRIVEVRERAFDNAGLAAKALNSVGTKDEMLAFIQKERAKEFVGEGIRRWDLMRWGILKETLDQNNTDLYSLGSRTDRFKDLPNKMYYKKNDQNGFDIYGLNLGETTAPSGWSNKTFLSATSFKNYIDNLYDYDQRENSNIKEIMPIMNVVVTNNRGYLENDYNY